MKIDCDALAMKAAKFGGLRDAQADGLAVLFKMIEREAFCDGVRHGRTESFAIEPAALHERYASKATTTANRAAGSKARGARKASSSAAVRPHREHSEQAAPPMIVHAITIASDQGVEPTQAVPAVESVVESGQG